VKQTGATLFGLTCIMQMCRFIQREDDTAIWGECLRCGEVVGKTSRASIRRYMEREFPLTRDAP
jgi:hypothetical protein